MESRNSYSLIRVGLLIRYLRRTSADNDVDYAIRNITTLERGLMGAGLTVSISGMAKLIAIKTELSECDPTELLGTRAKDIVANITILESIIFAESRTKSFYILPERRYNTTWLLNEPGKLFRDGVFQKLPDLAQFDIASAGRCILFGEGTAAAFHWLRATEDVLRTYYRLYIRRNRLPNPMWASMVSALRSKGRNKPAANLLDTLDLVRVTYRNPTQHPEARYDVESAQDLMGFCISVISDMADEIPT